MKLELRNAHYTIRGSAPQGKRPLLIILHGFMGSGNAFKHLLEGLQQTADIITIDLLGHGTSSAPDNASRYELHEQIADMAELILLISPKPVFLLGYSMGGRLALRVAIQHPELLNGLILESTDPGIRNDKERVERRAQDLIHSAAIFKNYAAFTEAWNRLPIFASPLNSPKAPKEALRQIQLRQRPAGIANSLKGFGASTLDPVWDLLPQIEMPVLSVTGSLDQKYISIWNVAVKLLPKGEHEIIPDAGHRVHIDRPDLYIASIHKFIQKHSTK